MHEQQKGADGGFAQGAHEGERPAVAAGEVDQLRRIAHNGHQRAVCVGWLQLHQALGSGRGCCGGRGGGGATWRVI